MIMILMNVKTRIYYEITSIYDLIKELARKKYNCKTMMVPLNKSKTPLGINIKRT
jgi:hypothetical protein